MNRTLLLTAVVSSAFSACTIVDTGGVLDNVGRSFPVVDVQKLPKQENSYGPRKCTVYTYQDTAYIEIPVQYQSLHNDWFKCCMIGGCPVYATYPYADRPNSYRHPMDGLYLAVVPKDKLHAPDMPEYATIQHDCTLEPFPRGTETTISTLTHDDVQRILNKTGAHRTWYNHTLQPLRWCAEIADIPLSIMATPVNWFFLPFGNGLWKY